ncbi:MAG: HAD family phosphatase [Myxococcales bacterium]
MYQLSKKVLAEALILDMDGLLVDSEPLWFDVERDFARARGADFTPELGNLCAGRGMTHTLRLMEEQLGLPIDPVRDTQIIVDMVVERVHTLRLKPGARELVDSAASAQVPMALASSSARRLVEAVLGRFELRPFLSAVVCGDEVERVKPAPDLFLFASAALGVLPSACVVLEDSMVGVLAARAAKMRVFAVPERDAKAFEGVADRVMVDLHEALGSLRFS